MNDSSETDPADRPMITPGTIFDQSPEFGFGLCDSDKILSPSQKSQLEQDLQALQTARKLASTVLQVDPSGLEQA